MFYKDLSPYQYHDIPTGLPGVLNVGWLDSDAVRIGDVDDDVVQRIVRFCEAPILATRGLHECGLCGRFSGNAEVWIPADDGRVYASPSMLAHYIRDVSKNLVTSSNQSSVFETSCCSLF